MGEIRKVAVIGAGTMGAGIAAHVANAGIPALLLDVSAEIARGAVARLLKTEPAAFMTASAAKLVTAGGLDGNLAALADCNWIVEAVVEDLAVKRALYVKIEEFRKPDAVVSSNTSTIPLAHLTEGLPAGFRRNFIITHFFNPPRHMRLLEVVVGPDTGADAAATVERFADFNLGKSVVRCRDRPGFIANRLGCFWMQSAIAAAFDQGLEVEEADAIIGKPFGIPKTGIFGLADLVGIDLMPKVNASLARGLAADDLFHRVNRPLPFVEAMIAEGFTGRKGKGGFYRINREQGKRKEAIDLATGAYRPVRTVRIDEGAHLLSRKDRHGRYAAAVMIGTLAYAAMLVGDVAEDIAAIDEAMRLGYNWRWGPFELIDRIGVPSFRQMVEKTSLAVAPILGAAGERSLYRNQGGALQELGLDGGYHDLKRPEGVLLLEDVKRRAKPLLNNASAALWDIGDGAVCFEFTGKMNTIDSAVFDLLDNTIDLVQGRYKALVVYNESPNFSVGVNLGQALFVANIAAWDRIEALVARGQQTYKRLKYAPFPAVAAPAGMALGGGCEILLHCSAIQAHAESYVGLVETGVGVIPGWGGCKEMLTRGAGNGRLPRGPMPPIAKAFETLSTATVSRSAAHARELMFFRPQDGITMNRNRLLADAKAKALALAEDYRPPEPPVFTLPGPAARLALDMAAQGFRRQGLATDYDMVVAGALAEVLSGGDTDVTRGLSEDDMLAIERREFMKLVRRSETIARIEHMLDTGKPLRN